MEYENCYKPISHKEIQGLRNATQVFSDCYLVSSINSLTRNSDGRQILKENIQKSIISGKPQYKIKFQNIYDSPKDIFVTKSDFSELSKTSSDFLEVVCENKTLKAVEIAMGKVVDSHPLLKSLFNRMADCEQSFEYNNPSRFFRIFTGKEPTVLNEKTLNLSLRGKREKTFQLLDDIEKSNGEHSFVAGTSVVHHPKLTNWHCYVLEKVNLKEDKIQLYNQREGKSFSINAETFIRHFKFLVGLLPKDFKTK